MRNQKAPKQPLVSDNIAARLRRFEEERDRMVDTIRAIVQIESPSDDKFSVDRVGRYVAERFAALGGAVRIHKSSVFGDHVQVDFEGESKNKPVLLLGHIDTVYPLGTLSGMPCHIRDGRLFGPGVLDMKSGIGLIIHAIEAFQAEHASLLRPVKVLLVSD